MDVGTINGVDRSLCGDQPALPAGSLRGAIALVTRGGCPYNAKAARASAAGATGIVIAENRPGDPSWAYVSGMARRSFWYRGLDRYWPAALRNAETEIDRALGEVMHGGR